ncbi:MAG: OadG family protein [Clostridia bacterium]|nr:OadG family protein [Clostridia bacterium]
MLNQLLANGPIEAGLLTFVLGMLVTFFGIAVIVICVSLAGKIFNKTTSNKPTKVIEEKPAPAPVPVVQSDDVPEHVKVAIIAAISAYYYADEPKSTCDFIVRRIKRI